MKMPKKISLNLILKKSLALFVAFVILISTLTVTLVTSAAAGEFWDGSKDSNISGSGTETDPYLIETPEQLAYIVTANKNGAYTGKYFKLANDIKINDTSKANWKESARNWVWADFRFIGPFDGDGHTIDGLYFNGSKKRFGLFSYVGANDAGTIQTTIKNFKMTNAYIENAITDNGTAFVAGQASKVASFHNIYIDDTCEIVTSTVTAVGGILGQSAYNVFMSNIAMNGKVTGKANVGAFVGSLRSGARLDIKSSYTTADLYAQGVTDRNLATASGAVYVVKKQGTVDAAVTLLTLDQMKGENAKTYMTGLSFKYVWEIVENDFPVYNPRGEIWDGTNNLTDFSTFKGAGTHENPYIIENGNQLAYAVTKSGNELHYKLANDIVLNDTSYDGWQAGAHGWVQNSSYRFNGEMDGDGHTIEGLYWNAASANTRYGLFAYCGKANNGTHVAVFKNITFTGASVNHSAKTEGVAIVAGQASGETIFENIYIDESCKVNAPNVKGVAGLVGRGYNQNTKAHITIKNCAVLADITGGAHVGAFAGTFWDTAVEINASGSFAVTNTGLIGSTVGTTTINKVYTNTVSIEDAGAVQVDAENMKGEAAKTYLPGLDFKFVFEVVENGYPIINPKEAPPIPDYIWDGSWVTDFTSFKGSGTEEDPYLIENGAQLAFAVAKSDNAMTQAKHYKLANDIILNDTSVDGWEDYATPWVQNTGKRFNGEINGDGHTIEGLYWNANAGGRYGLVAYSGKLAEGNDHIATFKNIVFKGASVNSSAIPSSDKDNTTQGVAIVVGQASGETIFENIYIDESCKVNAPNVKGGAGLVGRGYNDNTNAHVTIKNCVVLADITGGAHVGAFAGTFWDKSVFITANNSFAVTKTGLIGSTVGVTVLEKVYSTALSEEDAGAIKVDAEKMKGEDALLYMPDLDYDLVYQIVENGYPIINIRGEAVVEPVPEGVWDGSTAESFAGGNGAITNPYLIENGAQLRLMLEKYSTLEASSGVFFKLTKDIYLNNVLDGTSITKVRTKKNWLAGYGTVFPKVNSDNRTNTFNGSLDGDGHVIYGMYISGANSAGLFPGISGRAEIKNLGMENLYIAGGSYGGAFAGQAYYSSKAEGSAKISYCYVKDAVIGQGGSLESAAGFIGATNDATVTFKDCYSHNLSLSNWDSKGKPGGFTGLAWGSGTLTFENCYTADYFVVNSTVKKTEKKGAVICTNVYTNTARPEGCAVEGVTVLTTAQMKGNAAKTNFKGFDFDNDWSVTTDSYPELKKGAGRLKFDTTTEAGRIWNGKIALTYASGTGTEADPFIIKTGGQLALLVNEAIEGKTAGKHYKLAADIILNDTSKADWESSANAWFTGGWGQGFKGHLDGDYHMVSGLFYNNTHETYTTEGTINAGLFPSLGLGAVVEKLGVVNSSLTHTHATAGRRIGAIAGYIDHYDEVGKEAAYEDYPIIRECFADTTVYIKSNNGGGLVGSVLRPVRVEDCFFTGTVDGTGYGIFGYSKMGYLTDKVLVKNVYAADSAFAIISNTSYDNVLYENCYSSSAQDSQGVTRLFIDRMCGKNAAEYMLGFDFNKVWAIRADNETPGLKGFNQKAFSNEMNPEDITISFETNCDLVVEPMVGKAYSKLTLPVLEREGYTFEGWYSYAELDTPYTFDYFPTFNIILYAKWSLNGLSQDFENYEDSVYDYHEGIEYYRPTTEGYTAKYVRSGAKSMHRIAGGSDYRDFLLFYNQELEIGKTYKMVYYTTTDMENAAIDVSLVHLDWPDVYTAANGIVPMGTIENLTDGKWVENTFTFVAKSKWIAIRTEGEASIYFDDFTLYSTSDKADDALSGAGAAGFFGSTLGIALTVAAAAVVLGGAGAAIFFVARRKK